MSRRSAVFTGVCTALVTPFDERGNLSVTRMAALIDDQIFRGADALCVCGTTGESSTLSIREHLAAIEFTCKYTRGRVPVIAGTGANDTNKALYLSQCAEEAGADALLVVTPYYNKTTQAGLIRHYETITDKVELPVILYNVPTRTGLSFTAETYQVLAMNPKINGVKEASGNLSLVCHTRRLCGEDFTIWSGNDDQTVPLMSLGAKGVISVASNVAPEAMARLTHLCLSGEYREAAALQTKLLGLTDALFLDVNPIPVKAAMNLLGQDVGGLRAPLCEMEGEHLTALRATLEELGLFPACS